MPAQSAAVRCQLRLEHDRVKMLLAALDLPDEERKAVTAAVREVGRDQGEDGYLTFRSLDACPGMPPCPVRLQARSYSSDRLHTLGLPYFLNFERTFLFQAYAAAWWNGGKRDGRPFGLVVGMPNVRGGVVLHDAVLPAVTGRTTLVYETRGRDQPPVVTVEPYKTFLRRLVKLWLAGEAMPAARPREEVRPWINRWMVRRLGTGPALVVFAWLCGAWLDPHKRYLTARGGRAWLCVTQPLIARLTGLGLDSVKRGLATLRRERLILTTRGDRRLYVEVAVLDDEGPGEGE